MRILISILMLFSLVPAAQAAGQGLPPCPSAPHCVSSLSQDKDHHVPPLSGGPDMATARENLIKVLKSFPRVTYKTVGDNRIHAEFTSLIFRFTDDVDFLIHQNGLIDVRSASRIGYWDFGVNHRRVEKLRKKLDSLKSASAG